MACVVEGPGPYAAPTKVLVATDAEALAAVNRYAAAGCVQIKIYSSLDPKLVPGIVARAHALGLRVSGHIPNGMKAEQAVREGFDEIQHANFLFLNFLDGVDTRTMDRLTAVGEHAGELDLKSPPVQAFLRLLKEKKTVSDPTVNVYEAMFASRPGEINPAMAAVAARLPLPLRRSLLTGNVQRTPEMDARYRASFRATLALVLALHDAGIPIVAGTDSVAGFCLHRELEDYVAAGLSAPDALRARHPGARPGHAPRQGPRHHRPRQARRPHPRRRRSRHPHLRHPPCRPHHTGRGVVRRREGIRGDRGEAGGVKPGD